MSLHADALKESQVQRMSIKKETTDILGLADAELKSSHELGRCNAIISLPILFSIPHMSNAIAQAKIYSIVIKSLEDRGFYVKLNMHNKNKRYLEITWMSNEEQKELDEQKKYIAEHNKQH